MDAHGEATTARLGWIASAVVRRWWCGGGAEGERVGAPLTPRVTYAARRSRSNARRASTLDAVETQ